MNDLKVVLRKKENYIIEEERRREKEKGRALGTLIKDYKKLHDISTAVSQGYFIYEAHLITGKLSMLYITVHTATSDMRL